MSDIILGSWNKYGDRRPGLPRRSDVEAEFREEDALDGATAVFAVYETDGNGGQAIVLFVRAGKLYGVFASHCSCYGLEDQWQPELITNADAMREWAYMTDDAVNWAGEVLGELKEEAKRDPMHVPTPGIPHSEKIALVRAGWRPAEEMSRAGGHGRALARGDHVPSRVVRRKATLGHQRRRPIGDHIPRRRRS